MLTSTLCKLVVCITLCHPQLTAKQIKLLKGPKIKRATNNKQLVDKSPSRGLLHSKHLISNIMSVKQLWARARHMVIIFVILFAIT